MNHQDTIHQPCFSIIDQFCEWVITHPKCRNYSQEALAYIIAAAKKSDELHSLDRPRKVSGEPYITHPIGMVEEEIKEENQPHWKSIVTLLLHDTLESHPTRFREIFDIVPIDVFGRILKLSKFSPTTRIEIQDFLVEYIAEHPRVNHSEHSYILEMLTTDPSRKDAILVSIDQYDEGEFQNLLHSYAPYLDKYCPELSQEKKEEEIDGLWHYIFFDRSDARHKFRDTMHNLSDIRMMDPIEKERYILRRTPKVKALAFVLRRLKMFSKLNQLKRQWQWVGGRSDQYGIPTMHHQSHQLITEAGEQVDMIIGK